MSFWLESISLGLPCIQPAELWSLCVFPGLLWGYRVSHGVPQAGTPCLRLEAQQQTEPVDRHKLFMSLLHPTTSTRWDVSSSSDAPLQYMVAGREHQLTQWLLDVISVLGENATFTRFPGLIYFSLFFALNQSSSWRCLEWTLKFRALFIQYLDLSWWQIKSSCIFRYVPSIANMLEWWPQVLIRIFHY